MTNGEILRALREYERLVRTELPDARGLAEFLERKFDRYEAIERRVGRESGMGIPGGDLGHGEDWSY